MRKLVSVSLLALLFSISGPTMAAGENCAKPLANAIDAEFGDGAGDATRCLANKTGVKVVYQINQLCKSASDCSKPYALGNIKNARIDYTVTHKIPESEIDIVAIVHSAGWKMIVKDGQQLFDKTTNSYKTISNPYQAALEGLIANGVRVYFCQNTARKGNVNVKLDDMVPGVGFATSGVSALADLQASGYMLVQP